MREVHADLVRAAGLELDAHQRVRPEALYDAIARYRAAAVRAYRHARAMNAVPPDRLIDRAACGHRARAYRQILPSDLAGRERCDQRGVRFGRARHHEEPARILVEPVHEPRARHPREGLVHRLDKDTSGLLVVARTPE